MTESRVVITAVATRAIDEFRRFRTEATNALEDVSKSGGFIGNALGAVGAALSVAAFTGWIKGAIDATDAASDLSQRTGVAIEDLAGLELALQMGGLEASALEGTMSKLSKEIVGGNAAFEKLGVKTKDATGQLKSSKDMLYELADKFANMEDGVQKVALAQEIFGKSGAAMLPVLNGGAEGLREMDEMARKLGLSLSQEAVDKAGEFNDTLDLLMLGTQGVARGVAAELLPTLSSLTGQFLTTMTSGDKLKNTAAFLATGLRILYTVGAGVVEVFSTVGKTVGAAAAQIVALMQGDFSMASQIGRQWLEDVGNGWKGTLASIEAAWASATDSSVESMVNFTRHSTELGLSAAELAEQSKKAAKAQADEAKVLAELAGLTGSFAQEWDQLGALYAKGKISLEQLTKAQADLLAKQPAMKNALAAEAKAREELADFEKKYADAAGMTAGLLAERVTDAEAEAVRNEELARTFGLTKSAIEQVELARLRDQLAQRSSLGLTLDEITHLENLIAVKERSATALASVDAGEAAKKAGEDLDKFLDPTKAQTFGEALKGAFGAAGDSLTQLIGNLDAYGIRQAEVDKARKDAATRYATDSKGYAAASEAILNRELRSRVTAYGDMATAAKGFFSEGSKGYHVLETAEKAFRAYELAMAAEGLAKKLFFKEAEVAAHTTLNGTKLAGEAAATAASTGLAATEASAWGVTAVVKAIASLPFPLNLAAGAATMAAVVAVGAKMFGGVGGAGVSLAQSRQESQGTGSVFGDSGAKSESIARSLERVEDNTYQGLAISMGMLNALTSIQNNIGSFSALVVRDTNITGKAPVAGLGQGSAEEFWSSDKASFLQGGPFGIILDKLTGGWLSKTTGKIMGAIFGGKTTLEDSGFTADKTTLGTIANGGLNAMSYAEIKKDGGWFRKDKTSTQTNGLGDDGNRQITNVLLSLSDSVREAGLTLGLQADAFTEKLSRYEVDIGKISFKDMKADEIEKTLQAVFSKLGDDMAQFAVGGLEQYQQVGEGYLETLVRIAQGYQSVDVVLQSMGMTFGAIGVDSIAARQRLLDLSGGVEKFVQSSEQFLNDFFTEQEQAAALKARVQPVLSQYGLQASGEDATKKFRDYLVALDPATEAGAKAYAVLSQIAPALKRIADAEQYIYDERKDLQQQLDELTMTSAQLLAKQRDALDESNRALFDQVQAATKAAAMLEERTGLQQQLDELTMTSAQLLAKQRDALDESNRPLFDQINALKDSRAALEAQAAALEAQAAAQRNATQAAKDRGADLLAGVDSAFSVLQAVVNREKALLQESANAHRNLSSALQGALDGMAVAGQERDDRIGAQAQIRAALAIAKASGVLPDASTLKGALSILSKDASSMFATQQDYLRDFYSTQNDIADLAGLTDKALSVDEQSLQALDAILANAQQQVDALKGIDTSIFSLAEAISGFQRAIDAAKEDQVASAGGELSKVYKELLGRQVDRSGLEFYTARMAEGITIDQIREAIKTSDEYKALHGIPGFASGGMFGGGLRLVGENGPELEVTGPSRIFSASQTSDMLSRLASPAENNAALVAEIRALRSEVSELRRVAGRTADATEKTAGSTEQLADQFDEVTEGGNAMRADVVNTVQTKEVA